MSRIIYLCPADNKPTGGIKVIYRHAEMLCDLGADAYVLHPFDTTFRCDWFDHKVRLLDSLALACDTDFVVIPELYAGIFGPQCQRERVRYAIFVQNGYITHPVLAETPAPLMNAAYCGADLVLTISDDSGEMLRLNYPELDPDRIVRVHYSVHPSFLAMAGQDAAQGSRSITYMPRKMAPHAARVVFALGQHLPPGWTIQAIHDVDEATCAAMLFASSIFLAFSELEGLPLPPLEAALAGNLVIGYTGQGAREYWIAPNFEEIHQGDIIGFVKAARCGARSLDEGTFPLDALRAGQAELSGRFSAASEAASLTSLLGRIGACFPR